MATKKQITIEYSVLAWTELNTSEKDCGQAAIEMLDQAYAPYSRFSVGACAMLSNGNLVRGSNQENAAYPSGLCAERVALFAAKAQHPDLAISQLYIVAKGQSSESFATAHSCGNCRQVMIETECRQDQPMLINIIIPDQKLIRINSAKEYLPFAFDQKALL